MLYYTTVTFRRVISRDIILELLNHLEHSVLVCDLTTSALALELFPVIINEISKDKHGCEGYRKPLQASFWGWTKVLEYHAVGTCCLMPHHLGVKQNASRAMFVRIRELANVLLPQLCLELCPFLNQTLLFVR